MTAKKLTWSEVLQGEAKYLRELLELAPANVRQSPELLATWLVGCGVHCGMSEWFVLDHKTVRRGRWWKWK